MLEYCKSDDLSLGFYSRDTCQPEYLDDLIAKCDTVSLSDRGLTLSADCFYVSIEEVNGTTHAFYFKPNSMFFYEKRYNRRGELSSIGYYYAYLCLFTEFYLSVDDPRDFNYARKNRIYGVYPVGQIIEQIETGFPDVVRPYINGNLFWKHKLSSGFCNYSTRETFLKGNVFLQIGRSTYRYDIIETQNDDGDNIECYILKLIYPDGLGWQIEISTATGKLLLCEEKNFFFVEKCGLVEPPSQERKQIVPVQSRAVKKIRMH